MKKLSELLEKIEYTHVSGPADADVSAIVYDSRKDCTDALFICISGTTVDAHKFIPQVIEKGAAAIVVEKEVPEYENVSVIRVPSARKALSMISAAFFDYPTEKMVTIGYTGTKGKTTSTYMLKTMLEAAGKKVGLIGTNGAVIGSEHFETKNTTPESYELQRYFHEMAEQGCDAAIMEVSSQGLMMDRVAGITFDYGVFTNLSPDHIGKNEHASFEEYRYWKGTLFKQCRTGIVNADDPETEALLDGHTCEIRTYGIRDEDYTASAIRPEKNGPFMGAAFELSGKAQAHVKVGIPGVFNVYNALSALAVTAEMGLLNERTLDALKEIRVNGRMELVYSSDAFSVIVDYAHNGVSTRSLLKTLREYEPGRIVTVFGCGGNRDPHRRYEMGAAAGELSDLSIITADNSRNEAVENIMADIHIGLDPTGGKSIDIPDRREAIAYAIRNAQHGDVIAIIGKGHETYQEVNGVRTHFSDREEAEAVIKELHK